VRRRRILINALSLGQGGGGRSYLLNVLRELDRDPRGFDFTVLADPRQLPATESSHFDVAQVRLPEVAVGGRITLRVAYEEAVLPIRARRFDLLYCLADLAPAVAWTPTVVALRNLHIYDRRYYDTVRLRLLWPLVRAGVRRARRVLFPTRAAADWIAPKVAIPARRIAVVPHGVAPEAFDCEPTEPTPAPDRVPYLFLPASLERHKRVEVLIRCLQHVANPGLEVWIAGSEIDAAHAAELRRLAQDLGVASRVRFLGPVPYRQILHYHRRAVALAFPSLLESFGHPTLEAMLAGTPIIAADIPSFREIAGDVALYFKPDDPIDLARAVDELHREPDAAGARIARGRLRAAEFSWRRSVDGLCQVFDAALAE
jgi:glycosyltransferase involved in cell wall biosynthesis